MMLLGAALVHADNLALIGHPQGPATHLQAEDIKRIYVGAMRAFPDTNVFIRVADQPAESTIHQRFYQGVFGQAAAKVKHRRAAYLFGGQGVVPKVFENDDAVKEFVASTPAAIGYIQRKNVDTRVKVLSDLE